MGCVTHKPMSRTTWWWPWDGWHNDGWCQPYCTHCVHWHTWHCFVFTVQLFTLTIHWFWCHHHHQTQGSDMNQALTELSTTLVIKWTVLTIFWSFWYKKSDKVMQRKEPFFIDDEKKFSCDHCHKCLTLKWRHYCTVWWISNWTIITIESRAVEHQCGSFDKKLFFTI